MAEKAPVPSRPGGKICDRDGEDGVPAPDLRLGQEEVQEDLEIRIVLEVKRLRVQGLRSSLEVLRPA